jgi:transglutaminase-like putative cysteine protease
MEKVGWNNRVAQLLTLVFGILSFIVLNGCVTTADGSTYIDLNTLIFGNYVDESWTHVQLPAAPSADGLMRLSAFTKEASNLARYANRAAFKGNTWHRVVARGQSVYFIYKDVRGVVSEYIVYKSKYAIPAPNPTITQEELRKVELAYAETVRDIERRGKRLYVSDRNAFIRQYQGNPETESVAAAKYEKLEWYDIKTTSQEEIVAAARNEPSVFRKVRLIHDWVSDVFAYDYDLLWWMDTVSGKNAEFTLAKIVERQRGVCLEYAILFWFLMDSAGVETYLISDHSEPGIGHAYNMVVINNTGYIIDTTWDSGNKYEFGKIIDFKKMISKDYFMPNISQSYNLRGW